MTAPAHTPGPSRSSALLPIMLLVAVLIGAAYLALQTI